VEALDPIEVEPGQLPRGDLAGPQQLGLVGDAGEGEIGVPGAGRLVEP
jgi:hypothetical protein